MTIKPNGNPSIGPIFDEMVDAGARAAAMRFIGEAHTFTAIRTTLTHFELYLHDERTPGGILINPITVLTDYNNVSMVLGAGNILTITQANGNVVTEDLTPLLGTDVHLVSLTLAGNTLIATDSDANTFPIDLSTLAFVDGVQLIGNNLVFDFGDGSQSVVDLSAYVNLPADGVISSFTLVGTTATIGTTVGTTYPLDMSSLNETLADNGDGTYTFNDGEGNLVLVNTATPSVAAAAGVDTFGNAYPAGTTLVTFADGQVLAHVATVVPPATPQLITQEGGVTIEPATARMNFIGDGLDVTNPSAGVAAVRLRDYRRLGPQIVITSSGTYTPSGTNVAAISVELVGAGGGSTGAHTTAAGQADVGAPGWGGSYCREFIENPGIATVTIGAGGAAYSVNAQGAAGGGGLTRYQDAPNAINLRAPGGFGGHYEVPGAGYDKRKFIVRRGYITGVNPYPAGASIRAIGNRPTPGTSMGRSVYRNNGIMGDNGRSGDSPFGVSSGGYTEIRGTGVGILRDGESDLLAKGAGGGAGLSLGGAGTALGIAGVDGVCVIQEYRRV